MVNGAIFLLRHGLGTPKKRLGMRALRVLSSTILSLVVGIMYDTTKLQDDFYMMVFIVVIAVTILTVTLSTILE